MRPLILLALLMLFVATTATAIATVAPTQPLGTYDTNDYYLSSDGTKKLQFSQSDDGSWTVEYWELRENGAWAYRGTFWLESPLGPWDTDDTWSGLPGDTPMGINTTGGPDTVKLWYFSGSGGAVTFHRSF